MKETDPERLEESIRRLEEQIKEATDPAVKKGLRISLRAHKKQLAALRKKTK